MLIHTRDQQVESSSSNFDKNMETLHGMVGHLLVSSSSEPEAPETNAKKTDSDSDSDSDVLPGLRSSSSSDWAHG